MPTLTYKKPGERLKIRVEINPIKQAAWRME